ncbi:hypothetical protein EPUS_02679 [Endocarpon pusillum Z07020]|uniref:F-box domain-containing protein n=1 Tax=Endocarpon pusillum (strain Z07020 / HMAS-L-300199) TaxID=1263415 RepID=U1GH04_ENDPU|nr:uncharacterized protein EPUS_02679 [Endocarpon pusillum Z07020]ERF76967.1 hypothetical protein EPUS_02679 [Endocarpon pusillum Z07020]
MQTSLNSLPFDLVHVIASSLDVHDFVHLSRVSRRYQNLLQNESMARRTLQVCHFLVPSSSAIFDAESKLYYTPGRDKSFTIVGKGSARPYSVSLLAYGEAFFYSEGVLCYVDGPLVRVIDIYSGSQVEDVVNVLALNQRLSLCVASEPSGLRPFDDTRITNLSYSKRILVCVCESEVTDERWLLVVDLGQDLKRRVPFRHPLTCTTKLFIRHDRDYLYYGTHSGRRSDGHHEWLVTGLDLEKGCPITPKPFQLADFVGSDIGSTACFKIHEKHLYAVSNQTSFEVEEVDWTSYYHYIKIPLGDKKPDLKAHRIWQRQHGEGPINDSWTDLSLQKDEQTNELLIIECRKEWLGGGSANIRTYYTQPLRLNTEDDVVQTCHFPADDPLTRTLDEYSKPHFSEPQIRIRKYYHHEYEQSRLDPRNSAPRDFILAKTKFRAYSPSAMSFIDLVSDPAPVAAGSVRMRERLRLRIASRRQKSPLVDDPDCPGQMILRKPELDKNNDPIEGSEEDFHPTEIHLWPPDDAPTEIYDVLCPAGRVRNVEAIADERSIIYMTDAPSNATMGRGNARAIVMISFDPSWGKKYKRLIMPSTSSAPPPKEMKLELENRSMSRKSYKRASPTPESASTSASASSTFVSRPKRQKCDSDSSTTTTTTGTTTRNPDKERRFMWKEGAMYLSINRGYRLR